MSNKLFSIENDYYRLVTFSRIEKFISQLELFKKTISVKGDIIEFGVYKGNSLIRLIAFNKIFSKYKKKIFAFDIFGKFPKGKNRADIAHRKNFVKSAGENSINKKELNTILIKKKFRNFELIDGDVIKTIPVFLKKNIKIKVSFINLDLDLYEPSLVVLEKFYPKLSKKGIIMLDNFNQFYGETLAVKQFCKKKNIKIKNIKFKNKVIYYIQK